MDAHSPTWGQEDSVLTVKGGGNIFYFIFLKELTRKHSLEEDKLA